MVHQTCSLAKRPFHRFTRRMVLKPTVRATTKPDQKVICLSEMTNVMKCWKKNDFNDYNCTEEIKKFLTCVERKTLEKPAVNGSKYDSKVLNEQLKIFDSPR